jgi:serine/threonine protein kinase
MSQVVKVSVIEAKNLAPMDRSGQSDPYVVVKATFSKQQFKTSVIEKTLDPIWKEEFTFHSPPEKGVLLFKVWDRDMWTPDDFLGELELPLEGELLDGKEHEIWRKLDKEPKTKKKDEAGQLHLKICVISDHSTRTLGSKPVFSDKYNYGKPLGEGGFATVKEAIRKGTNEVFAVKIIKKKGLSAEELELLQREVHIMSKLDHPRIVRLVDVFEDQVDLLLVLELAKGGELFDRIIERGSFSEKQAAFVTRQVLEGVAYMHDHGIVHRDLKPENLLCVDKDSESIKVADFGLSKEGDELRTACGSPGYVAPEIIAAKDGETYDNTVDVWSIGVITYILLCGFPPFSASGGNPNDYLNKVLKAQYDFPDPEWTDVSSTAKDFIKRILVPNPGMRPSAKKCLEHPWLCQPEHTLSTKKNCLDQLPSENLILD